MSYHTQWSCGHEWERKRGRFPVPAAILIRIVPPLGAFKSQLGGPIFYRCWFISSLSSPVFMRLSILYIYWVFYIIYINIQYSTWCIYILYNATCVYICNSLTGIIYAQQISSQVLLECHRDTFFSAHAIFSRLVHLNHKAALDLLKRNSQKHIQTLSANPG